MSESVSSEQKPKRLSEGQESILIFHEMVMFLWGNKLFIGIITLIFAVLTVIYSLSIPNKYKSTILLAPSSSEQKSGLSGFGSQLGGIASLAGINLNSGSVDKTTLAVEILKSKKFIFEFVSKYQLEVPIIAGEGWDPINNKIITDSEIYDFENDKWIRDKKFLKTVEPTALEIHKTFVRDILQISVNEETGLVTISVVFYSPEIAAQWVDWLLLEINNEMRKRDIVEATKSIRYLNQQLAETKLAEAKNVLYQLIEDQSKTLMLANVRDEYVFRVIDPSYVPEEKDSPKRAIICIIGTLLGFFTSIIILVVRSFIMTFKQDGLRLSN